MYITLLGSEKIMCNTEDNKANVFKVFITDGFKHCSVEVLHATFL